MNKARKNSFKQILLTMLLIGVMIDLLSLPVMAASPVTVEVNNMSELLTAIENAQDGDVIGFRYGLNIYSDTVIGDPNKHLTLKRMDNSSYLSIGTGNIQFQNVTIDGGGISASSALVMVNYNVTFDHVTFLNSISNSVGGAVCVNSGTATFNDCLFENNSAIVGGHIAVKNSASITVQGSTFKAGQAGNGGAIGNLSTTASTTITSSIITGNSAGDYGGGLSNKGTMTISGTKLFNNSATNGGADIGNTGTLNILDSMETLVELFKDDGIIPKAWVNDYDFEAGLFIPDIDPAVPNSLLKLNYDLAPTKVTLAPSSLGSAADSKITGLESGKYYKVTVDDVIYYVKADGSLTST